MQSSDFISVLTYHFIFFSAVKKELTFLILFKTFSFQVPVLIHNLLFVAEHLLKDQSSKVHLKTEGDWILKNEV